MNRAESEENKLEEQVEQTFRVCHQYCVISPLDIENDLVEEMEQISGEYFNKENFIEFIEKKIRRFGHSNARLLYRIRTDFFWNGAANFMLENLIKDSSLLKSAINTLICNKNGIIKLTKYQIYLIMCHMFLGTFPPQLFIRDSSFGTMMTVKDNEDEISCSEQIEFRLNKLKSLIRFFCVHFRRFKDGVKYGEKQYIIFQRHKAHEKDLAKDDATPLCKVFCEIGEFYESPNQINAISINTCSTPLPGSQVLQVCGSQLDMEERIFLAHTQMQVLTIMIHDPLRPGEAIVIYGAEKFIDLDAVNPYEQFSFNLGYSDNSIVDDLHGCRKTTFIFVDRKPFLKGVQLNLIPDIEKMYSGLIGCTFMHSKEAKLVSGKFQAIAQRKSSDCWEVKFIAEWISASLAGWKQLTFFVEDDYECKNLVFMVQELRHHTAADLLLIIKKYDEIRFDCKAKISFMTYLQNFVL